MKTAKNAIAVSVLLGVASVLGCGRVPESDRPDEIARDPSHVTGAWQESGDEGGKAGDTALAPEARDPLLGGLPFAVRDAYKAKFPGHRLWQVSESGTAEATQYDLTIFDPGSSTVHGRQVGSAHVRTLQNYHLILTHTVEVVREEIHPIAADSVPKAARDAFERWRRPYDRSTDFTWYAYQDEGAERLYRAHVTLNSIEDYGATLKADGTIIDKHTRFQEDDG